MKTNKLFLIAALLGTALVGCQKVAEIQTPEETKEVAKTWTLTVKAVKSPQTRAMAIDGTTLNAYWKAGEIVAVYDGGTLLGTLEVKSVDTDGVAELSGEVPVDGLKEGVTLTLIFPGKVGENVDPWTYLGQDGAIPADGSSINDFDYATSEVEISELDSNTNTIVLSSDEVEFSNQQSIYRFGFVASGLSSVKSILLSSSANQLARSLTYSSGDWAPNYGILFVNATASNSDGYYYMSVRNENTTVNETYTFNVVGDDDALYVGTKNIASKNLGQGKFLSSKNVAVAKKAFTPETTGEVTDTGVL